MPWYQGLGQFLCFVAQRLCAVGASVIVAMGNRAHWRHAAAPNRVWVGIGLTGLLVAVCYGFALRLPLFFDDLPIMTWVGRHNWWQILASSESAYYRPLTFIVYKLGQMLAPGPRQVALHTVNLLLHWVNGILVMFLMLLWDQSARCAITAAVLFVVYPFVFLAVPWVTALGHPMVTFLTLVAVCCGIRAERDGGIRWWVPSLLATALAPFAHESGPVCGAIVGGSVIIYKAVRPGRRAVAFIAAGLLLSVLAVVLRSCLPGIGGMRLTGLKDWVQNTTFFVHGLVYPLGPLIGEIVERWGWQDLTLVQMSAAVVLVVGVFLAVRGREWRWVTAGLWWWLCGALPSIVALPFSYLYISPRLLMLASVGIVTVWALLVDGVASLFQDVRLGRAVGLFLAGSIVLSNGVFLGRQRGLFIALNDVYQDLLLAAAPREHEPLAIVNLPTALASQRKTYAMILENVIFIPWYSNVSEFIEVNIGYRDAEAAIFTPVRAETEDVFGAAGEGLNWEGIRSFATIHRTVWLARYDAGRYRLDEVGSVLTATQQPVNDALVDFGGGARIEAAAALRSDDGRWRIVLDWWAAGPVDGEIFVHVRDRNDMLVGQIDGPALGGMVPIWMWERGDRIRDIRYIGDLEGDQPFRVQVGIYNESGRLPAWMSGIRCPDDAASVVVLEQ